MQDMNKKLEYIKDKAEWLLPSGDAAPEVYALGFLMLSSGIFRLFTREDVWQLAYRIQLIFDEINFAANLLSNEEEICEYQYEGKNHTLKMVDLYNLVGMEIIDARVNFVPEDYSEESISKRFQLGTFLSIFNPVKLYLSGYKKDKDGSIIARSTFNKKVDRIDDQLRTKAKVFADQLTAYIDESLFERIRIDYAWKLDELETRRNAKPHAIFDWDAYTEDQKKMIYESIFADNYEKDKGRTLYHIMHLCWALIYEYVDFHPYTEEEDIVYEIYEDYISLADYEIPDESGGVGMCQCYIHYDLSRVLEKMIEWEGKDKKDYEYLLSLS